MVIAHTADKDYIMSKVDGSHMKIQWNYEVRMTNKKWTKLIDITTNDINIRFEKPWLLPPNCLLIWC